MERKESNAEAIYTYDALQKRKPFLDQLMEGLEVFHLGTACRLFEPLFVSTKECTPEDVLQILQTDEVLGDRQQVICQYLKQFLVECNHNGKQQHANSIYSPCTIWQYVNPI